MTGGLEAPRAERQETEEREKGKEGREQGGKAAQAKTECQVNFRVVEWGLFSFLWLLSHFCCVSLCNFFRCVQFGRLLYLQQFVCVVHGQIIVDIRSPAGT